MVFRQRTDCSTALGRPEEPPVNFMAMVSSPTASSMAGASSRASGGSKRGAPPAVWPRVTMGTACPAACPAASAAAESSSTTRSGCATAICWRSSASGFLGVSGISTPRQW
jgi:hypothetical protein